MRRPRPTWTAALAAVAALPVVVATARALLRGWLPMGDNAYFSIRSRDVLTEHHPLVGAWSSGSQTVGFDVNNLGPLQLDLLAAPVKVDWAAGTAIGVAAVNVAAIVLAVWVAGRVAGRLGAACTAAAAAGLSWAMGSELLFEPRQHHALLLPFLCFLVLVWALLAGRTWALPVAAGVGSLLVQTHLTYVLLVVILGGAAAVAVGARVVRHPEQRSDVRRAAAVALVVAAVCWVQPVVEQLTAEDRGNLAAVLEAAQQDEPTAGAAHGARAVATVTAVPPWWAPATFSGFDPRGGLASAPAAGIALTALAVLLLTTGAVARRAGRPEAIAAVVVAGVALVAAWANAASQPSGGPFGLVAGNYRWLWPVALFTTFVLVGCALARLRRGAVVAAGAAVVLAVLATVPAHRILVTREDEPLIPVARELVAQLDGLRGREPIAVARGQLFFGEPYTYVLLAGLQDRGIDFDVVDELDVRRFGEARAAEPGTAVLTMRSGDDALVVPDGWERIALVRGLDPEERRELERLRQEGSDSDRRRHLEERWQRETISVVLRPGR